MYMAIRKTYVILKTTSATTKTLQVRMTMNVLYGPNVTRIL